MREEKIKKEKKKAKKEKLSISITISTKYIAEPNDFSPNVHHSNKRLVIINALVGRSNSPLSLTDCLTVYYYY